MRGGCACFSLSIGPVFLFLWRVTFVFQSTPTVCLYNAINARVRFCWTLALLLPVFRWVPNNEQRWTLRQSFPWWRHQMDTFSALLAICAGNSPVSGEFPAQRPVTRSLDIFFDLRLNKRLSKQSWGWWFETLSSPSWRHCNALVPCHVDKSLQLITDTLCDNWEGTCQVPFSQDGGRVFR